MCDETFDELTEEARRLARDCTIITKKKKDFSQVKEEVKALKSHIDSSINDRVEKMAAAKRNSTFSTSQR